jgi:hypothetical protein
MGRTYITPNGGEIESGISPDNGIDKCNETGKRRPEHVSAGASIPSMKMPWQGHKCQEESKKRENWKQRVRWVLHNTLINGSDSRPGAEG